MNKAIMSGTESMSKDNLHRAVRDRREKPWYWKNNAIYDFVEMPDGNVINFAVILGTSAMGVYDLLTRMADEESQICFPSVRTIAYWTGIGETTISDSLALLRYHKMIEPQERVTSDGDSDSNQYTLLPIAHWSLLGGNGDLPERLKNPLMGRWQACRKRKRPDSLKRALKAGRIPKFSGEGRLNLVPGWVENAEGGGLKFEDKVHLTEQASKEQTSNNRKAKIVIEPAAGVDFEDSKNGNGVEHDLESRIAKVVEVLCSYKLAAKTIRDAAHANIEHAEYVAREFGHEKEADAQFWVGRSKGSTAGALRLRLENTDWQSSRDIAQQESDQQNAVKAEQRARVDAQREIEQKQSEQREFEAKVLVSRTMGEFERLTPQKQSQVFAEIKSRNEFLCSRSGGNLRGVLESESVLRMSLIEEIAAVLQEWKARQPELSDIEQRAAGEIIKDKSVELEATPSTVSRETVAPRVRDTADFGAAASSPTIARLMAGRGDQEAPRRAVVGIDAELKRSATVHFVNIHYSDAYTFDEIDEHRGEDFSDNEWAQVLVEVERMLNEAQRLAA